MNDDAPFRDDDQVVDDARAWLRANGPASAGELVRYLGLDDAWIDDDVYGLLLDEELDEPLGVFPLTDGRLCELDALLEGVTLTHEVTARERRDGTVALDPDLAPLQILSPDGRTVPHADGQDAQPLRFTRGAEGLTGPQGWLPDAPVLTVTVVEGRAAIRGVDAVPPVDQRTAERLASTFEAVADLTRHPTDEVELLIEARARYPQLLATAQAPLGALLATAGLAATDRGVRPIGMEDEPDDDWLVDHLYEDHDLDGDEVAAVLGVQRVVLEVQNALLRKELQAWHDAHDAYDHDENDHDHDADDDHGHDDAAHDPLDHDEDAHDNTHDDDRHAADDAAPLSPPDLTATADGHVDLTRLAAIDLAAASQDLATALANIDASMALVDDVVDRDALAAACLLGLLHKARDVPKVRTVRANTAWVRARALELVADDHTVAERELRRAVELDPAHGPATFDLAGYLSDRGQAGAALGLLAGIDGPGVDDLVELLTRYAARGPMSAGRNDPCPCGSGRKHKVCCAVRGGWPLGERMPWLMHKLMSFYASPSASDTVTEVARDTGMAEDDAAGSYRDTAALNLALFEGGVIADMCDLRGALLPADELALLRDWSQVRAGLYELVDVADDDTCTLLDLRSGERYAFTDHSLAHALEPGGSVLAWLIADGEQSAPFYGVINIPDRTRSGLLDLLDEAPSAEQLGRWLRELYAPPRLATTAGDAMVAVTRTYAVRDGAAAQAALADHLDDDGEARFVAFEERDGQRWLKGSIEVTGDELVVSTMSVPRAAWFAQLLARVVPDAELVDEERLPMDELLRRDDEAVDGEAVHGEAVHGEAVHGEAADGAGGDGGAADGAGGDGGDTRGARPAGGALDLDTLPPEQRAAIEAELAAFMTRHEDTWPDTPLPALDGATPREALDDPTRREAVLRLLDDMQRASDAWQGPGHGMDPQRLRRLLGLT